jgi:hypothetical protein
VTFAVTKPDSSSILKNWVDTKLAAHGTIFQQAGVHKHRPKDSPTPLPPRLWDKQRSHTLTARVPMRLGRKTKVSAAGPGADWGPSANRVMRQDTRDNFLSSG